MPEPVSRARAVEVGEKIAAYFRANPGCFQEQAALAGGIAVRVYYKWLDGEGEAMEAFQALVLPALLDQAKTAEETAENDIARSDGGSSAWAGWHKWKLAQRYRKIFGDLAPQRVELTGKDGGPIQQQIEGIGKLSLAELKAEALRLAGDGEGGED